METEEFVELVVSKGQSPEEEMLKTWEYLDTDQSGEITIDELRAGLSEVGILLAPWEVSSWPQ